MYIERVPNRNSPPAVLLREAYREGGKVKKRTLVNLSKWPEAVVEGLRVLLKGGTAVAKLEDAFDVVRSRPHGHVATVVNMLRRLKVDQLIGGAKSPDQALVLALITARILDPRSKLATARELDEQTQWSTLGEVLGVENAREEELYAAMDWLLERQPRIEAKLAERHLRDGSLVLYDTSSTYFEGRTCPLARLGHNKDGKKGKLQIVFGLLCNAAGCPVAVEVFSGNTADPVTLGTQVEKLRTRFGLERVVWVGDRGLITAARIREELAPINGLDWITALRAPQIRELVDGGSLQLSLFDEKDLAEISDPAYPGERLVVCRNPLLAQERARKRTELLAATERELDKIVQATLRTQRALKGADQIGLRVGKVLGRFKMAKHFTIEIGEERFAYTRDAAKIAAEAALDGFYVIRTSVASDTVSAEEAVRAYKGLSVVERAFRSIKTVDLKIRPIHHRLAPRVKAHVFLCMLAYYVEWHMRQALAPMLFDDHDPEAGQAARDSEVAPAQRSPAAHRKAASKKTEDGLPVHSFQTLLADLATISKDRIQPRLAGAAMFDKVTRPTPVQQRALDLLGVHL
ncbi:MAG: IS1634 family transposase [Deferrisomatales bacterium]